MSRSQIGCFRVFRGSSSLRKSALSFGNNPSKLPILMVTAKAHPSDIVLGLETGADDYLTKPFELPVFLARVRALLRRTMRADEDAAQRWELGNLLIDGEKYQVTCLGKEIQLTPSEFKLLIALAKQQGRVLTRERLIDLRARRGGQRDRPRHRHPHLRASKKTWKMCRCCGNRAWHRVSNQE